MSTWHLQVARTRRVDGKPTRGAFGMSSTIIGHRLVIWSGQLRPTEARIRGPQHVSGSCRNANFQVVLHGHKLTGGCVGDANVCMVEHTFLGGILARLRLIMPASGRAGSVPGFCKVGGRGTAWLATIGDVFPLSTESTLKPWGTGHEVALVFNGSLPLSDTNCWAKKIPFLICRYGDEIFCPVIVIGMGLACC